LPSKPAVTFTEDFYRLDYRDEECSLLLERIGEKRGAGGGIVCELTVESSEITTAGILYSGNWNLLTSHKALSNDMAARRSDVDWLGVLTQAAGICKKRYREGDPLVDLAAVESSEAVRWVLPGFVEATSRPTLVAAGGGTGKSTLGLGAGLSVATGVPMLGIAPLYQAPVLYLDWEADPEIHHDRMIALWQGAGRDPVDFPHGLVMYQRMVASMSESATTLRRKMAEMNIGFVVLDSIGMARGGAPEDAESTIKLFSAARTLNVPILAIDHLSKEVLSNPAARKGPIGSVYTENNVCRVWIMESVDSGDGLAVSLKDVKRNNGKALAPLSYRVHFEDDDDGRPVSIRYERASLAALPHEIQTGGNKWRLAAYLEEVARPVTDEEAVEGSGIPRTSVRVLLNRHPDMFGRTPDGRITRVSERVENF
jgi:hypothetical protein